ncbi:MAG TPA: protein kinase [Kofleriaceae bacterium]
MVKTGDVVEGRYRIIKTLGEGGMGTVFLAEHALIKRRVAIKILHPELATDADVIERFMNEARAAGTLGHPNIVESTDMGFTAEHVPYIVFEYLEGALLTDEVYRVGGLPVRRAVRIAQQIASALYAAHNANIVHRDLKSDNVFLTDKDDALDHVKVLDFGISRFLETDDEATRLGMVMGTPEFMAPEQITDPASVDKRADIYALGVILYEMLTARRPFSNDEDPRALMHRIVNNAPPPLQRPEVPHALCEMIMNKMLAKNPADRYQSMMDVEAALDSFVTSEHGRAVKKSRMMAAVGETEHDIARRSDLIPRPQGMLDTPWPPTTTLDAVSLPQVAAKKQWVLYGIAAAGLALGAGGLFMAMNKGGQTAPVATNEPAPAVQQPLPAAATTPAPRDPSHEKVAVQLSANAPNARVTFRRRVSAAPSTMQITPSDIVELVEVSAPGYKTTRYWLTFDRPTTLNAKLAKGSGNIEATEEDTLVALGEMAAPTQAVAAATAPTTEVAKPAAAAKVASVATSTGSTSGTATVARTTRRIGHAGEDQAEETKADSEEKVVAAKEETTEVAMADTKPEPAAEPAKAEPAPAKAELPEAPKATPAAKTDVIPAAAQTAQNAQAAVAQPSIDRGVISSVISQHRIEVLKCFAEGKKSNTSMKGTVNLTLNVDAAGKVHSQVQSTLGAPMVAACVIKAANTWKFPARNGATDATVTYPFTIN